MTEYLLQHLIDNLHSSTKDKILMNCSESTITVEEFYSRSNQLANCLKDVGIGRQERVALCLQRSVNSIIAMFGVLKADAIYVPVDEKIPVERFSIILKDCEPAAIICDSTTLKKITDTIPLIGYFPKIILLDVDNSIVSQIKYDVVPKNRLKTYPTSKPYYRNIDTDAAYILYTSGSTGKPKGVLVKHLNVINYINWSIEYFNIKINDVILSTAPFHFDMSVFDIYCSLKTGGRLAIATDNLMLFPKKLINFIEEENITIWKGVSSLLMYIARTGALKKSKIESLKRIIFAGEVLPTKYLIDWMECFPNKFFYNGYGPTETTGMSTCYWIEKPPKSSEERIPIGKACNNTEVFILNTKNKLAKKNETGEICIRGSGLSLGYWNNDKETRKHFVPNPLGTPLGDIIYRTGDLGLLRDDNNLEYISRKDDQVKWMGYRIELNEIENFLIALDYIKDASVIMVEADDKKDRNLVAFVEGITKKQIESITTDINRHLPKYMRPKRIIPVDHLPRTDRGKKLKKDLIQLLSNPSYY